VSDLLLAHLHCPRIITGYESAAAAVSIHLPTTIHQRCLLFNIYNSHYFHPIILIYYSTWLYHLYLLSECSFVSTAHQLAGMFTPHIYSNHSHLCQWCV